MKVWTFCRNCLLALACSPWATVLAQVAEEEEKGPAKSPPLAVPYIIVLLAIGLGVLIICARVKRSDEARTED